MMTALLSTIMILKKYQKEIQEENKDFEISGFAYDENQDIYYSVVDSWQREYGYCRFFDYIATPLGVVMDSEPIIFEYNNKLWLIEFWKGQYGMSTGAEIGIYATDIKKENVINNLNSACFNKIADDEMLHMSYALFKNNRFYFLRTGKNWWLSGFKVGDFANPKDLSMFIKIEFKDIGMCNAFVNEMLKMGYTSNMLEITDTKVNVLFDKPYSKQPWTRLKWLENIVQKRNKFITDRYKEIVDSSNNSINNISLIKQNNYKLYKKIKKIGLSKKTYDLIAYLKKDKKRSVNNYDDSI